MTRISRINCILFVLAQLYFPAVTNAYLEVVPFTVRYGDEIIKLNWKRTGQHLMNKHTPTWLADKESGLRRIPEDIMTSYSYVLFHDVAKSSAVVYYVKLKVFYGVIDTRFRVHLLPLSVIQQYGFATVGETYIKLNSIDDNYLSVDVVTRLLPALLSEQEISYVNSLIDPDNAQSNIGPSSSIQHYEYSSDTPSTSAQEQATSYNQTVHRNVRSPPSKVLYPEILVFVSYSVYARLKEINEADPHYVMITHYLDYFNRIDLLLSKLASNDIEMHLNIAGFVIELEPGVFSTRLLEKTSLDHSPHVLDADAIKSDVSQYINKNEDIFPVDSFDFFFVSIRPMTNSRINRGTSQSSINIYRERMKGSPYINFLGAVVEFDARLGYIAATREIAKLMTIEGDSSGAGSTSCSEMRSTNIHNQQRLGWSENNRKKLREYIRFNRNHCFLLNSPRSLHPYNQPLFSLTPENQCTCYGFFAQQMNPLHLRNIPDDACNKPLKCLYRDEKFITPLPIDGTPCDVVNKFCWRKQCVPLAPSTNIDNLDQGPNPKRPKLQMCV